MKAVILAGGRGRRLAPYTTVLPKPLMPIGDVPILEVVIRQLKYAGFTEITMAVGYLAELLMAYFGDGSRLGVKIEYSRELEPLGTAGPISLIEGLEEPFLVMNGDLLTTIDYRAMWAQHHTNPALATVATYRRDVKIDLGVLQISEQNLVQGYIEKPTYHYMVSTGIYIFDPEVLEFIKPGHYMDLPDLVLKLLAHDHQVAAYYFDGYWLDIGRHSDYEQATQLFNDHRSQFLPGARDEAPSQVELQILV